jgi:4-amino-4-deoxy-L-arabinose transferase-like glycosyltransferase
LSLRAERILRIAWPFGSLLLVVLAIQFATGTYSKLLAGNYDEASHYLSSLMVRDYLASGLPGNPVHYAENYYLHYPKIAIGHWPPVLYLMNGLWLLLLPPVPASAFLFLAVAAAVLATRIYFVVLRDGPVWAAWLVAVCFLTLPPVVSSFVEMMSEILLAWLVFEACMAFARWMDLPGLARGCWFALWSSLALLTKAVGGGLAFLPACAIPMARRSGLFLQPSLILAGVLFAGASLPWYLLAPGARHEATGNKYVGLIGVNPGTRSLPAASEAQTSVTSLNEISYRARRSLLAVPILAGWLGPLLLVAVIGLIRAVNGGDTRGQAVAGLLLGFLVFRFVLVSAAWVPRMAIPMVAPLMCFLWTGREAFRFRYASHCLAGLLVCVCGYNLYAGPHKAGPAPGAAFTWLTSNLPERYRMILVSGDGLAEGSVTVGVAQMDRKRPGRYVVRASKVLAVTSMRMEQYSARAAVEEDVLRLLDEIPVDLLVVQPPRKGAGLHEVLLHMTIQAHPERFRRVALADETLEIYEYEGHPALPAEREPRLDLYLFGLGHSLRTQ